MAVLRQLRSGRSLRPTHFPWSIALCGVRDVRDDRILSGVADRSHGASPFNVKDESLTLRNFTRDEVAELYQQHTADTGQAFSPEALALVFELTGGQPWLVNALGRQLVETVVPDRGRTIGAEHVDEAREILIERRDTHLDSLADKLHEPRVRRIIDAILSGGYMPMDVMNDDLMYVRDLGLVVDRPVARIANPIYAEVIPRSLTYVMQANFNQEAGWYEHPDGSLDMAALLRAFQRFFAEHSESWLERYDYKEAGPHLILMAFLQRILNGGGRIHREFALGSARADMVITRRGRRHVLELKLRRSEASEQEGLEQLDRHLDRLGETVGFLLLFDRRPGRTWQERLYHAEVDRDGGRRIHVFGM